MTMRISTHCKTHIKFYEGLRTTAYKCPAGVWTIGYGHTRNVTAGMIITEAQADRLFDTDIAVYENTVECMLRADEIEVTQCQFDALVSMAYNLGPKALYNLPNNTMTKLWKALKAHKPYSCAYEFLSFNKAGGVELIGLTARRETESKMFLGLDGVAMSGSEWKAYLKSKALDEAK